MAHLGAEPTRGMAQQQAVVCTNSEDLGSWTPGQSCHCKCQRHTLVQQSTQTIPYLCKHSDSSLLIMMQTLRAVSALTCICQGQTMNRKGANCGIHPSLHVTVLADRKWQHSRQQRLTLYLQSSPPEMIRSFTELQSTFRMALSWACHTSFFEPDCKGTMLRSLPQL